MSTELASPTPTATANTVVPDLPSSVLSEHQQSIEWAEQELQRIQGGGGNIASSVTQSSVSPYPMRINSLDATSLDHELNLMLGHSLRRVFKYVSTLSEMKAELELVLSSIVFMMTIGEDQPTPGMRLQNVTWQNHAAIRAAQYTTTAPSSLIGAWWSSVSGILAGSGAVKGGASRIEELRSMLPFAPSTTSALVAASSSPAAIALSNFDSIATPAQASAKSDAILLSPLPFSSPTLLSTRQKSLYFLFSILLRYGFSKLTQKMTMDGWGGMAESTWQRKIYRLARRVEQMYQAANILNFIVFLKNGCYRSLLERFLSIRLLYLRPHQSRSLSFEFMNQQIAWSSLSEFMLFLLPLINFGVIQDGWKWLRTSFGFVDAPVPGEHHGCPVCLRPVPNQPYKAQPCGHIYCYCR